MDDQKDEFQDSSNPDAYSAGDDNAEPRAGDDSTPASAVDESERLREQNRQLFARLKKLESKLLKVVEKEKSDSGKGDSDSDWREKIEFLVKRRDFDADELEVVSAFAKGMGKPLEEAVKHPAVEGAIRVLREKKAAEKATLESSGRQPSGEDTSLLAKWKAGKLTPEEFRKNFGKIQEEFFSARRGNKSYE